MVKLSIRAPIQNFTVSMRAALGGHEYKAEWRKLALDLVVQFLQIGYLSLFPRCRHGPGST